MNEILSENTDFFEREKMAKKIREQIDEITKKLDIECDLNKKKKTALNLFLDNFYMNLPSKKYGPDYSIQNIRLHNGNMTHAEGLRKKMFIELCQRTKEQLLEKGHSERFIFMSKEDFSDEVEVAISESAIDREKLEQYINQRLEKEFIYTVVDVEKIETLFLPIYIKLREKGYTHKDLTVF